ncbi:MAG: ABC transporter substrate-binding protein [Caldilineae bacterium]|nr:MAG: ABC transporter substrate-binding protein [Caldilineae bacterium]
MTRKTSTKVALLLTMLVIFAMVINACGPSTGPEEQAAEQPAQQEEAAPAAAEGGGEEAAPAQEEAAAMEIPGPSEYPEPQLIMGSSEIEKLPLDQILTYKALDSYSEPDWVSELVAKGDLPPVEERLPKNPRVILESGMRDGLGVYGGVWRDFSACPTEGYNRGAGQSAGWFGIEAAIFASLLKSGPIYRRSDALEPMPYLASGWEWSEDGYELTMHLMEGAKWSDGQPITTEDVLFSWEDMILDPNVQSPKGASAWEFDGEMTKLEVIDDYTFKFIFPIPFPVQSLFQMDQSDFHISPAHILKPLHPRYNSDTDYVEFEAAMPPDKIPVVAGPWVPVEYKTDELMILRRNPYFWSVDESGKQLPYLDEVVFEKGPSGVGRTLATLAGSADHSNLENPSTFIETLKRAEEPDAHFRVEWGPETLGFGMHLNMSKHLGVKDERDAAVRELFRDLRFRKAVSFALDRDGIAQSILRGPFLRGWAGGLYPGSAYFDRSTVAYFNNNPDAARALLADIGFSDTDGDGILNWPTDMLASGENLVLALNTSEDAQETQTIGDAVVTLLGDVGIKVNARPLNSAAANDLNQTGEWDMRIFRGGQEYAVPFTRCTDLAALTKETPSWHREGSEPRELLPFEQELADIVTQFCREPDTEKRKELMRQYNTIFTENVYHVGVIIGRYGLAIAKRFKNIPAGMPVFLYDWTWENAMPEQVWVAPEEQLDQLRPGVIPTYGQ